MDNTLKQLDSAMQFSSRDKRLLIRCLILRLLGVGVTLNEALFPDPAAVGFPTQRDIWRDTVGEFVRQGIISKEELTRQLSKETVLFSTSEGDDDWLKEARLVAEIIQKLVVKEGGFVGGGSLEDWSQTNDKA